MTEELAGKYASTTVQTQSGDAVFLTFPVPCEFDTTTFDTSDACVGDPIGAAGLCNFKGDLNSFSYTCLDTISGGGDCNIEFKTTGMGMRNGATIDYEILFIQRYLGTDCSGACTTFIDITSNRIGDPDCPRKAPGGSSLFSPQILH